MTVESYFLEKDIYRTEQGKALDSLEIVSQLEDMRFLSARNYMKRMLSLGENAESIWLQTMTLADDPHISPLFDLLVRQAGNGADVRVNRDSFSKWVIDGEILSLSALYRKKTLLQKRSNATENLCDILANSGVDIATINPGIPLNNIFPPTGRNHGKLSVIKKDNHVHAFIGGMNLTDRDYLLKENPMLELTNSRLVEGVMDFFLQSRSGSYYDNRILAEDSENILLMDGGVENKSIIMDHAEDMIANAKESIYLTTQFAIDAHLARQLSRASEQGVQTHVIVSDPRYITGKISWLFDQYHRQTVNTRSLQLHSFPGWLHTKILATDIETPAANGLFGSHNFSSKGIQWKNQEIALRSINPETVRMYGQYIQQLLLCTRSSF